MSVKAGATGVPAHRHRGEHVPRAAAMNVFDFSTFPHWPDAWHRTCFLWTRRTGVRRTRPGGFRYTVPASRQLTEPRSDGSLNWREPRRTGVERQVRPTDRGRSGRAARDIGGAGEPFASGR